MPFIVSAAPAAARRQRGPCAVRAARPSSPPPLRASPRASPIAPRTRSTFIPPGASSFIAAAGGAAAAGRHRRLTARTTMHSSMWRASDIAHICVVGGGNAAQVLAALLSHAHATRRDAPRVSLLAPFGDESARLSAAAGEADGIGVQQPDGLVVRGMPTLITADAADALRDARLVLLPLPTFAMPPMLRLIAPHVTAGAWVGALPAQGGFQWMAADILRLRDARADVTLFGLDKLPFNCRTLQYGRLIKLFGFKERLSLASIPNRAALAQRMASTLSQLLPRVQLHVVPNFLVLTLATSNQCIHPARMYALFARSAEIDHVPLFYEHMDEPSARLIGQVSDEMLCIARAVERKSAQLGLQLDLSRVRSIADSTTSAYEVADTSSLARIFQTCAGFAGIGTPLKKGRVRGGVQMYAVDWKCRYFTEDIPALCVLRGLAQLVDVRTPTIDMLIKWAQPHMDGAYAFITEQNVLNTDRKKLMYTPQYWRIADADALVRFHA